MSVSRRRFFGSLAAATAAPAAGMAMAVPDQDAKTLFRRLYECWDAGEFSDDSHDLTVTIKAVPRGEKARFIIEPHDSDFLLDSLPNDIRSKFAREGK